MVMTGQEIGGERELEGASVKQANKGVHECRGRKQVKTDRKVGREDRREKGNKWPPLNILTGTTGVHRALFMMFSDPLSAVPIHIFDSVGSAHPIVIHPAGKGSSSIKRMVEKRAFLSVMLQRKR